MSNSVKLMSVLVLLGAAMLVGGCSDRITGRSVRSDWSPELYSTAHSREQHKVREARTLDTNGRQAWDDLSMLLLLDRPSRMSEYPIP